MTLPSQAPASLLFPCCTKLDVLGKATFSLLTECTSFLSYLFFSRLIFLKPARLCMNCVLWAIYIYAFKEQTALFLPRWQIIKLFISSQYFTETVVFERKCHFTSTPHSRPLYTQTFTHSQRTYIFCCVLPVHIAFSVDTLLPQHSFCWDSWIEFAMGEEKWEPCLLSPARLPQPPFPKRNR